MTKQKVVKLTPEVMRIFNNQNSMTPEEYVTKMNKAAKKRSNYTYKEVKERQ